MVNYNNTNSIFNNNYQINRVLLQNDGKLLFFLPSATKHKLNFDKIGQFQNYTNLLANFHLKYLFPSMIVEIDENIIILKFYKF